MKTRLLVVTGAMVLALGGCSSSTSSEPAADAATTSAATSSEAANTSPNLKADVKVTSCKSVNDGAGTVIAGLKVTNSGSGNALYFVDVDFTTSAGEKVGPGQVGTDPLAAGESQAVEARAKASGKNAGAKCVIARIEREPLGENNVVGEKQVYTAS